jgi:DNA-binding SARP family transcriptional activator
MAVESLAPMRVPEADARWPSLELVLLHGFAVYRDGAVVGFPHGAQRLLAFLALADRPQLRAHVAGVLWPDVAEERAAASLRSTLWRIRRTGCPLVSGSRDSLRLAPEVGVDVRDATSVAHRLLRTADHVADLDTAGRLLAGDLLPDWYDEWVQPERERFRQIRLHALERLAVLLAGAGRVGEAVEAGLAAVAAEPLRESAHRALIQVYLTERNPVEALRQYEGYRRTLRLELGTEPSEEIHDLVAGLAGPSRSGDSRRRSDAGGTPS